MRMLWGGLCMSILTVAAAARADAQVRLTTEKPVYKVGANQPVVITVTNGGSQAVSTGTYSVWQGNQLVYMPFVTNPPPYLGPNQSQVWVWMQKNNGGMQVGKGSYELRVSYASPSSGTSGILRRWVALTPSGKLAGTSRFPLAAGNEWKYVPTAGNPVTTKVTGANTAWSLVENLLGNDRWVKLEGTVFPTLWVKSQAPPPAVGFLIHPLFAFNRPVGYTYAVNTMTIGKMKVGAKNETVETPAGKFTGCYRLDVLQSLVADYGYGSFWFAPGVGLVQYTEVSFVGSTKFQLHRAKIKGSDGKVYTIGLPN